MGKTAMMGEAKNPALKFAQHIQIRRFSSQRHCSGGQRSLAIQSRSAYAGAGQKMGNRFQSSMQVNCDPS